MAKPIIEIIEPRLYDGAVADEILSVIQDCVTDRKRCTVSLAGGSTPGGVYRALGMPPRVSEIPWGGVELFFGDERWVAHTDSQSNCRMAHETMLSHLTTAKPQVFPVDTSLSSVAQGASSYETLLRERFPQGMVPEFDLMLLGMGEDGHTASLFPGSSALQERRALCSAVVQPSTGIERVTMNPALLCSAKRVFFMVKGEAKAAMVKRVIEGDESIDTLPARLFTSASGRVTFFLDSGAAKALAHRV